MPSCSNAVLPHCYHCLIRNNLPTLGRLWRAYFHITVLPLITAADSLFFLLSSTHKWYNRLHIYYSILQPCLPHSTSSSSTPLSSRESRSIATLSTFLVLVLVLLASMTSLGGSAESSGEMEHRLYRCELTLFSSLSSCDAVLPAATLVTSSVSSAVYPWSGGVLGKRLLTFDTLNDNNNLYTSNQQPSSSTSPKTQPQTLPWSSQLSRIPNMLPSLISLSSTQRNTAGEWDFLSSPQYSAEASEGWAHEVGRERLGKSSGPQYHMKHLIVYSHCSPSFVLLSSCASSLSASRHRCTASSLNADSLSRLSASVRRPSIPQYLNTVN